jgi:uncharacterized Zn-finger protein
MSLAIFPWLQLPVLAYPMDVEHDITHDEWNEISDILKDVTLSPENNQPPALTDVTQETWTHSTLFNENKSLFCQPCHYQRTGEDRHHCVEPKANKDDELNGNGESEHGEHRTNERPHKCNVPTCGKAFKSKCRLSAHAKIHSDERPYQCNAPGCSRAFKTRHGLWQHKPFHTGERRFKCEQPGCGKAFKQKKSLKSHAYRSHVIG